MKVTDWRIVLASNSPRRKELLAGIDVAYEVRTLPDIDESYPESLPHEEVAEFLARKKADAYLHTLKADELLITADTIVLLAERFSANRPIRMRPSGCCVCWRESSIGLSPEFV